MATTARGQKVTYHHPDRGAQEDIFPDQEKAFISSGWKPGKLPKVAKAAIPVEAKKKGAKDEPVKDEEAVADDDDTAEVIPAPE